jgi:tight adherence protein C
MGLATHPAVLWLAALACFAVAIRARRPAGERSAREGPRAPRALVWPAAVPFPPSLARLGSRPRTEEAVAAAALSGVVSTGLVDRARVGGAILGLAICGALALATPLAALLAPVVALAGFLLPGRILGRRAASRRAALVRELPDLLDLLVISVEAGMALDPALDLASARLPGVLSGEVRTTLRELRLGTPRRAAYRGLADRVGSPELQQVVAALLQAEELGAPLSRALAGQAEALRGTRRQHARDRAARAAPRIQLVIALVMVPGALVLVMGVLLTELARQVGAVL